MNNWYFPTYMNLTFNSGTPVASMGGLVNSPEGCASISDKNGQLLFYTDGIRVWNKNNVAMPNGTGLNGGNGSATQSSVIVPKSADGLQYYIFTADEEGMPLGFQYSIVDMSLDGGLGAVTVKNVLLVTPSCEKVTAVLHCNRKDYWVITHKYNSDAYYAYLATETGVNTTPVISHTGSFIPVAYATMAGSLKATPNGKKLVAANPIIGIDLADFNNQTGVVSNAVNIDTMVNPGIPYGVEFSSNSAILYVGVTSYFDPVDLKFYSGVFQFDISLPTIAAIKNSIVRLSRYPSGSEVNTLQRGPDGKIYLVQLNKYYLSVIDAPNVYGLGCNYIENGVTLPDRGRAGLANFVNDFGTKDTFSLSSTTGACTGSPVAFNFSTNHSYSSLLWDFADIASGSQNTSTLTNPTHVFSAGGTYHVQLIVYGPCSNDTIYKDVVVGDLNVNLGKDTGFCQGGSVLLSPNSAGSNSYLWQDGNTSPTYVALVPGLYWVQVTSGSNNCIKRDSVLISSKPVPLVYLGKDTGLCVGQNIVLDAQNPGSQYLWKDNSILQTFTVSQSGTYWVDVNLNACHARDTIVISNLNKPQFSLGPDQYLCTGRSLRLTPGLTDVNYTWQDGSHNSTYLVMQTGLYYVDADNSCGTFRDSINITSGSCEVYVPGAFTPNGDSRNDQFRAAGLSSFAEFEMKVFNRYGEMIFITKDASKGWDGKFKGKDSPNGVYIYLIKYKQNSSSIYKSLNGTVVLLR